MIDLAPNNPYRLVLRSPVLARAGLGGAGVERLAALEGVGAVISDTLTSATGPSVTWHSTPAGVLWPDSGRASAAARRDLRRWAGFATPTIVAIRPQSNEDVQIILADVEAGPISAILLDLTWASTHKQAHDLAAELRRRWHYPILVEVPIGGPDLVELAAELGDSADAMVLGRGPQVAIAERTGLVHGRIVGPAAHPHRLQALHALLPHTSQPLIVGVASQAESRDIRQLAGERTIAFLLDVALWYDQSVASKLGIRN